MRRRSVGLASSLLSSFQLAENPLVGVTMQVLTFIKIYKTVHLKFVCFELGMMAYTCNPRNQEVETEGSLSLRPAWLYCEFNTSSKYVMKLS